MKTKSKYKQIQIELKELKSIIYLDSIGHPVSDTKLLRDKYEKLIELLSPIEKSIFYGIIYERKFYYQVGYEMSYSENSIKKIWEKIIKKLSTFVQNEQTNFQKISQNEETLAEIFARHSMCECCVKDFEKDCVTSQQDCKKYILEWLKLKK